MAIRLKRAWLARTVVVAAVCALPLFAVATAQASIAGANPALTTNIPDLRSATVLDPTDVQLCFDKAVDPGSAIFANPNDAWLGGYGAAAYLDANNASGHASNAAIPTSCVNLGFPGNSGQMDINQFTIVTLNNNAVIAVGGSTGNLYDSVSLTGSNTKNGVTNHSTAPDFTATITPTTTATTGNVATNSLTYVFDQNISASNTPVASDFWFTESDGDVCFGDVGKTPVISANTVTVFFTKNTNCPGDVTISDANRTGILGGNFVSNSEVYDAAYDEYRAPMGGNGTPNSSGVTLLPHLVSALLESSGNRVDYTFDKNVSATATHATDFYAFLSDGAWETGDTSSCSASSGNITQVNATTVSVPFMCAGLYDHGLNTENEYAVIAAVDPFAVSDTANNSNNQSWTNTPDSAPIGDNGGAFARGFTTGPDVYSVTIDHTNGNVIMNIDQRVCDVGPNGTTTYPRVSLVNTLGATYGNPSSLTIPGGLPCSNNTSTAPSNPEAISMRFGSGAALPANVTMLWLNEYCAFKTNLNYWTYDDRCNVPQVVTQFNSAAILRALHSRKHQSKKHHTTKRNKRH